MKRYFALGIFMAFLSTSTITLTAKELEDSLGIERKNGNIFILHKVEPKETFYSLSKRYKVSIDDIVKYNPEKELGLKVDDTLHIPFKMKAGEDAAGNTHTVAPSQTLFSIAKMYNVKVEDIKQWNNLTTNDLNVGQTLRVHPPSRSNNEASKTESAEAERSSSVSNRPATNDPQAKIVHIVEPSQTLFSISRMYDVSVEDIKEWNRLKENSLEVGQQLTLRVKSRTSSADDSREDSIKKEEAEQEKVVRLDTNVEELNENKAKEEKKDPAKKKNSSGFKKIVELGLAEIIEDASDTKKYVALHRTAPIGTIMQVTNEMNNQNVFVRVIGKLPETGVNDKVLIKLSKPAFERLGAVNDKFPAEISYVP